MAASLEDGLARTDQLAASGELRDYHLMHATRADFLRRLGRNAEAADAYREALNLVRLDAERRYLTRRLQEVSPNPALADQTSYRRDDGDTSTPDPHSLPPDAAP